MKVLATLRSQNVVSKNVFNQLFVCVDASTISPEPEGVDQVPSHLQNVEEDAEVPLFRLVTGRFPVTPVESGNPVKLVAVPLVGVPRA